MKVNKLGLVVLAVVGTLGAAGEAFGYVRTVNGSGKPIYWSDPRVEMIFSLGDVPPMLGAEDYLLAAQNSAASWVAPAVSCTRATLSVVASADAAGDVGADGIHRIVFRRDTWCRHPVNPDEPCYSPAALAMTSMFSKGGVIVDADIEINAVNYSWGDLLGQPSKAQSFPATIDLQNTLTHELGHVLGLDHSCWNGADVQLMDNTGQPAPRCGATATGTMAPAITSSNDVSLRTLGPDDIQGVCGVYSTDTGGGCSFAPQKPGRPVLPFLALGTGLLVAIVRLSSKLRAPWLISTFSRCRTFGAFIRRTKRS
jgi:hypothetical protein